jgi:putative peptidoglycan lipid II flippase
LRMLWLLIMPAAVILWLLGTPITRILFQRGAFTAADTTQVVRALNIYLIGMVFAAVDFPLNFAFYARNNTLLPALVGVASVVLYTIVALTLVQPLGYLGLVWADTAKQAAHLLIMVFLLWRTVGRLGADTLRGFVQIALAAVLMSAVTWVSYALLARLDWQGLAGEVALVALASTAGMAVFAATLAWGGLPEITMLVDGMRRKLGRR